MKNLKFCMTVCIISFIKHVTSVRFDNHTLFRVIPMTEKQLDFVKNLSLYDVIYWKQPGSLHIPVDFSISPEKKEEFLYYAKQNNIYYSTMMEDIQREFDQQLVKSYIRRRSDSFDWNHYYRLDDIYAWLKDLSEERPNEFQVYSIGKTCENRDIMVARIRLLGGPIKRYNVIVEGGIHAREWISPAFITYMIHEIFYAQSSDNSELKFIAVKYEWFFIPVSNPDGYEFSHTTNRLWRKNRQETGGVDLNRNFDAKFGMFGISSDKSSETYCGDSVFSEPESQALRNFITMYSKNLLFYISIHSYGQYIILPYAHSKEHLENYDEVKIIGEKAATRISLLYQTQYITGTAYDTVGYLVSGSSTCWVKQTFKIPFVVTLELRDEGRYGFALPAQQILPTCQETMLGMQSMLNTRRTFTKYNNGQDGQFDVFSNSLINILNVILFIILRLD